MDPIQELLNQAIGAARDDAANELANVAELWEDDTIESQLARSIIGSVRPLLDLMVAEKDRTLNPVVFNVVAKHVVNTMEIITMLRELGNLRKGGESS